MKETRCVGGNSDVSSSLEVPSRVVAAVRTEGPASLAASAPAHRSSQGGVANTTNVSGTQQDCTAHCSAFTHHALEAPCPLSNQYLQLNY